MLVRFAVSGGDAKSWRCPKRSARSMDDGPNDRLEEILLIGAAVLAVLIAIAVILLVAAVLSP